MFRCDAEQMRMRIYAVNLPLVVASAAAYCLSKPSLSIEFVSTSIGSPDDTIAAIATPAGRGGIGVVRVSGTNVKQIATALLVEVPSPRVAALRRFLDARQQLIDEGIALYFPAPRSFTGEDVLELHGHGGPVVMDMLLRAVLALGARLARPGEFSERAFLNEKLDLTQAEAIADLIESHSEQAARCAARSLQGEFSTQINQLVEALIELRTHVEAALDFPDEEVDFLADTELLRRLGDCARRVDTVLQMAHQGSLLREGMRLVIAGRPNVGKSTLLNHLAGDDAAIVSSIPGTTRDVMHREIQLDGMPVKVIDTAGLHSSTDPIEQEGIRRAWREIHSADLILLLIDVTCGYGSPEHEIMHNMPENVPVVRVWNKIDRGNKIPGLKDDEIFLSAKTGAGMNSLIERLKSQVGYRGNTEGVFIARRRHLVALESAAEALERATMQLQTWRAGEIVAEELRAAQQALGEITGEFTSEDLLGRIFSSFCIGK